MKLTWTLILSMIFLWLHGQEVYFKSVNLDSSNDSISEFVNTVSDINIRFSQSTYWSSRVDTTTKPNLNNYHLYIYKDSASKSFAIIVTPYFIFGPYQAEFQSIEYLDLYEPELLNSDLRPNKGDAVVDTSYFIKAGIPLNDSTFMFASYFPGRGTIIDGINKTLLMTSYNRSKAINYDHRLMDPNDTYYQYNSSMPIYTLILLLEDDCEKARGAIEWDLELAQQGILTKEDRVKWMLDRIPERKRELREFEKYLKQELKDLKKEKTDANNG